MPSEGSRPSPLHRRSASSTPSAVDLERGLALLQQPLLRDDDEPISRNPPISTSSQGDDSYHGGPSSLSHLLSSSAARMPSVSEAEGLMDRNDATLENQATRADDSTEEAMPPFPSRKESSSAAGKSWKWLWGVIRTSNSSRPSWSRLGQTAAVSDDSSDCVCQQQIAFHAITSLTTRHACLCSFAWSGFKKNLLQQWRHS